MNIEDLIKKTNDLSRLTSILSRDIFNNPNLLDVQTKDNIEKLEMAERELARQTAILSNLLYAITQ